MDYAPSPTISIPKEKFSESIEIKEEEIIHKLNIEVINENITLTIKYKSDLMKEYEISLTLDEITKKHKIFSVLESLKEFVEIIKNSINNQNLSIKILDDKKLILELKCLYIYKLETIQFELIKKQINFELIAETLFKKISDLTENYKNLEINYNNLIEENKSIKKENEQIKERLTNLENKFNSPKNEINEQNDNNSDKKEISINSLIINEELNMVLSSIKQKMNKDIKEIKKIYQASTDGSQTSKFHEKCDNIENTLILYKSAGNRRFGAFTSKKWKSEGNPEKDENCFLFSLDRKKIYFPKNDNYYKLSFSAWEGPSFFLKENYDIHCIVVEENAFNKNALKTYEKKFIDIFENDGNALSEDGNSLGTYAKEIEVFQVIF